MQQVELFVPGRLCLFGEHSDWAGGYRRIDSSISKGFCILVGTNQGIYARARKNDSLVIKSTLPDGVTLGPHEIPMDSKELLQVAEEGGFYSYSAGVAYFSCCHYKVGGLEIDNYKMDLPIRKGLSSSAANNVLLARAFNHLYDLKLTRRGEMELAYQGEIITPSRCGRMDQACAYGKTPVFITFDGDRIDVQELRPKHTYYMVVADLMAGKNTQKILADLNSAFPGTKGKIAADVRYFLGPINKEIVDKAKKIIENDHPQKLGLLMAEAQNLFDQFVAPACPDELASPALHKVLRQDNIKPLVYGGKGVGSQGDGCVQFLARGMKEQKQLLKLLKNQGLDPYPLTIPRSDDQENEPHPVEHTDL